MPAAKDPSYRALDFVALAVLAILIRQVRAMSSRLHLWRPLRNMAERGAHGEPSVRLAWRANATIWRA
jgi:hypothetical protein